MEARRTACGPLKALLEWYELHHDDLLENWVLTEQHQPLNRIPPLDLADVLWGPMFEPLRDPAVFRRFEVSDVLHTVRWENNADLAPEYLYQKMVEQSDARGVVRNG